MKKDKSKVIGIEEDELLDIIRKIFKDEIETCLAECRFGTEYKDEVWDRKTTSDFFQVSPEKITDMYNRKEIPGYKMGREYFFRKSQILNLFKKRAA